MKDTTFWPDEKQVARLAKSYKPNKAKDGLEEVKIGQLTYPLSDREKRHPMPAGGLFSTASDLSNFCRMILDGGKFGGKEYLSEKAVKEMTKDHSGLEKPWGLGWTTGKKEGEPFGHGGAHGTNMRVDPKRGLVLIYLIQHTGGFPGKDGGKIYPAFLDAATKRYAK
jgi:CubicO group peptidase (beta-lactamase class C family)